jgi:CheY-like chemotaxis protein
MAVKVLIVEDNPVARSFLCRVVRESFSDTIVITEAGDLESARRHVATQSGSSALTPTDPFKLVLVDLELPDGNGMELLPSSRVSRDEDRHHALLRRRPPLPGAAVRRDGYLLRKPLRGAGRGAAEDRARGQPPLCAGDRGRMLEHFRHGPARRDPASAPLPWASRAAGRLPLGKGAPLGPRTASRA